MKKIFILMSVTILAFVVEANSILAFEQEDIQLHGFASQGYLLSDGNELVDDSEDGTWEFNEIGFNIAVPVMDGLRFGMQFFSRDLGDIDNNEVKIDWAYLDYSWRDWLGLRAVKIKIPWGLYNKTRDIDSLRVSIFLPSSVYDESLRSLFMSLYGTSVYGTVGAGKSSYVDYELFAGTGIGQESMNGMTGDDVKIHGGALFWTTPVRGLKVGATALRLTSDIMLGTGAAVNTDFTGTVDLERAYVLSLQYEYRNLLFASEYITTEASFEFGDIKRGTKFDGWYAGISWRALDWLELGAYYSNTDVDNGHSASDDAPDYYTYKKDTALSTRFNLNEYLTFKLESHFVTGIGDFSGMTDGDNLEKDWHYHAAKISLSF